MPSLRDAIAALVAHTTSLDLHGPQHYALFPQARFPLDKADLALNEPDASFAFSLTINTIPDNPPVFSPSARFVWDAYEDVLRDRKLGERTPDGQPPSKHFARAQTQLGVPSMSLNELEYYATSALPVDLEDEGAWTPVALGREAIAQVAPSLLAEHAHWLSRFNLLPQLGADFVESLSFEHLTITIARPWFNSDLFGWRFWDMPGEVGSDGARPPRGKLPGVINKITVVRNLRLKLAAAELPDAGPSAVFLKVGTAPGVPAASPVEELLRLSGGDQTTEPSPMKQLRQAPALPAAGALKALTTRSALVVGVQAFHVPFSFDVTAPRALLTALHEQTLRTCASLETELAQFFLGFGMGTKMFAPEQQARRAQQGQALNDARALESRQRAKLALLDQLAAVATTPRAFVLGFVCEALPKWPNPDLTLFNAG